MTVFDCRQAKVPALDDPLPSDIALSLPGDTGQAILLCDQAEVEKAGLTCRIEHPLVFCTKLAKAHEYLRDRGASPGPIQNGGGTQFFEVRDPEGNVIEICKEP
jgi:hypothetical protein